jgi:hypothetical protein
MHSKHLWFNASAKEVHVPKRSVLKVVKVNYTPSAPWMVRVPEQLQKIEAAKKSRGEASGSLSGPASTARFR